MNLSPRGLRLAALVMLLGIAGAWAGAPLAGVWRWLAALVLAALAIEGLWALAFGNDRRAGDADDLYFTAGPGDEQHGLFGEIEAIELEGGDRTDL